MHPIRVATSGFEFEGLQIPAFELRLGNLGCLHLLAPPTDRFLDVVTGQVYHPELKFEGRIEIAKSARIRRHDWISTARPSPFVTDWLVETTRTDAATARRIVLNMGLRSDWRLNQLTEFHQRLLGLEAAFALGADVLIYDVRNLAPELAVQMHRSVVNKLHRCAAMRLRHAEEEICFPTAKCVEVKQKTGPEDAASRAGHASAKIADG